MVSYRLDKYNSLRSTSMTKRKYNHGKFLTCNRCGHKWIYVGNNKKTAACPRCMGRVTIREDYRDKLFYWYLFKRPSWFDDLGIPK